MSKWALSLAVLLCACNRRDAGTDVRVVRHHLSIGEVSVDTLERATQPTAIYMVTLTDVPEGETLEVDCQWRDPRGAIVHENQYETREIDHSPWTTHCRREFARSSQPGRWSVSMSAGKRILSTKEFEVR